MKFRLVICPMCGRTAGHKRDLKEGSTWKKGAAYNFWAREFDPDKPFGVVMGSEGRQPPQKEGDKTGTIQKEGYFQPEEDGEFFHFVKHRLLQVIRNWIAKGWLTEAEVAAAARGLIPPAETFTKNRAAPAKVPRTRSKRS